MQDTNDKHQVVLDVIDRCLQDGGSIRIDGLGSFAHDKRHRLIFTPTRRPLVFLAYAHENRGQVKRLFRALREAGVEPWMDTEKLLPGQNWPRAIERAIEAAQFFIACFSKQSVHKRGHFQCELAFALSIADRVPKDEIFFIPVRLDDCELPQYVTRSTHYVDLFPDWSRGLQQLIAAIRKPSEGELVCPSPSTGDSSKEETNREVCAVLSAGRSSPKPKKSKHRGRFRRHS